jgi:hypothetical protein
MHIYVFLLKLDNIKYILTPEKYNVYCSVIHLYLNSRRIMGLFQPLKCYILVCHFYILV